MSAFERHRRAAAIQDQLELLRRVQWQAGDAEFFYGIVRDLRLEISEVFGPEVDECRRP